jgi:hypothetical protein
MEVDWGADHQIHGSMVDGLDLTPRSTSIQIQHITESQHHRLSLPGCRKGHNTSVASWLEPHSHPGALVAA